jgi:hypothetical protein
VALGPELLADVIRARETIVRSVARLDVTGCAASMTQGRRGRIIMAA